MVAVVTSTGNQAGMGLGLGRSSLHTLGTEGELGNASFGVAGDQIFVNAASGNLYMERTDAVLLGVGPTDDLTLAYNSQSNNHAYGANNNWQTNAGRSPGWLQGTLNAPGSIIYVANGDDSGGYYYWNAAVNAYTPDYAVGDASNRLTYSSASNTWTLTYGKTGASDTFDPSNGMRIISTTDANGNTLTYSYTGNQLTRITTADGEYTQLSYTGSNLTQITTYYYAGPGETNLTALTDAIYTYDSQNRLSTVTTSTSGGNSITTTYGYSGTSDLVASISQTGGAQLAISYDGSQRVSSIVQTDSTGVTTTTSFAYGSGSTTVTVTGSPAVTNTASNVTTLTYDGQGQLLSVQSPSPEPGAAPLTTSFTYNSDGDVLTATDGLGNVTTYTYDSNDNLLSEADPEGNVTSYTYSSTNQVLTKTTASGIPPLTAGSENLLVANVGDSTIFDPLLNATDATGATLSITAISSPSHGTATIVNGGQGIQYTRSGAGTDTFTYTITDNYGRSSTATVTVVDSATGSSQAPTAGNMSTQIAGVGSTLTFNPLAYCSDVNGYPLTITAVSSPSLGTASVVNGGTAVKYTRTSAGTDSFTYTISDGHGHTATATITISDTTYQAQAPTAGNISTQIMGVGSSLTFDPRAYCSDVNDLPLTVTAVSTPTYGTATILGGGTSVKYTRTGSGTDTFTYTVSDGHGYTATATVTIADSPAPQNVAPTAGNFSTTISGIGTSYTVDPIAYDSDVNGFPLTITSVSSASLGSVSIVNGGTAIQYTRSHDGTDSFTYTVSDGHGHTATGTATILDAVTTVINAANFTIHNGGRTTGTSTYEFSPVTYATDSDSYTMSLTSVSAGATKSGNNIIIEGYPGALTYTLSDGHGNTATGSIDVLKAYNIVHHTGNYQDMSARNVYAQSPGAGNSLTLTPLSGVTESENNGAMTITGVTGATNGSVQIIDGGTEILYTASNGNGDTLTYTATDGAGTTSVTATIYLTGAPAEQMYAGNDNVIVNGAGTSLTFNPLANDADFLDYPLTITGVSTSSQGVTPTIVDGGTEIQYTNATGGNDSFTYTISDGHGSTATATVTVSNGLNVSQLVTAQNDNVIVNGAGTSLTFNPLANDSNFLGYPMTITAVSTSAQGVTPTIVNGGTEIQYTNSTGGSDSFTYTMSDGHGNTATATVYVTNGLNATQVMAPANDSVIVNGIGDTQTFNPLVNDSNFFDYPMTITAISTPSHGTASIVNGGTGIQYTRASAGNDTITYTLSDGHGGTATATISISGTTSGGSIGSASQSATTRYVYDGDDNLRFAITPDGEVTQYIYNASGEQTSAIAYANDVYSLSGLSTTQSPSLSTMTSWASGLSDLSNTQRTDTTYDFRGNVATVTTYSAVNASGAGLTTSPYTIVTYVYDQMGRLLSKQTSGQSNAETYTYDGLGRVLTATNLDGGVTTYQYTDSTNTTVATAPDGATTTSVYNLAGQLISQAVSGAGVTSGLTTYAYDSLGNLCMVTDADGNTSYFLYDTLGRKVAGIAADGSMTAYEYNADNQLVATVSYATKLTPSQMASLTSGGQPTDPALSTVMPASTSSDIWNWRIYDADGRLIETINGDGDTTVNTYDTFSNLTSTTSYANALSSSTLASFKSTPPSSLQLPTADPGVDAVTRYFYNNEGQVVATLNPDGYLAQTFYDDAGEKIGTLSSVNQASSGLWASGTLAQLQASVGTSSSDIANHYVYDSDGNLRYSVNGDLDVTEYDYNNSDQLTTTIQYAGPIAAQSSYTVATVQAALSTAGLIGSAKDETSYSVYDTATGNVDYVIDARGDVTAYAYNAEGNVTSDTQFATQDAASALPTQAAMATWAAANASQQNRVSYNVYNAAGQLAYFIAGTGYSGSNLKGAVTGYTYDADGNVIKETQFATEYTMPTSAPSYTTMAAAVVPTPGADRVSRSVYNSDGQLVYSLTAAGYDTGTSEDQYYVTQYAYNALGQVTQQTQYGSLYEVNDSVTQASLATLIGSPGNYVQTNYSYDPDGRVTDTYNALGYDTHVTYDSFGRVLTATVASGTASAVTTAYTYDAMGNLLSATQASGTSVAATTSYTYDAFGRVLTMTDPDGYATSYTYDDAGNVLTTTDPTGAVTTNTYDAFGNVQTTTDALGNKTYYFYDLLNRLTLEVDPMGYATATTYGFGSEIASVTRYATAVTGTITPGTPPAITTDPGQDATTTFTRDLLGRVTQETDAVGNTQSYAYDASGDQTSYTNQLGGTTTYIYDLRGLMLSETLPETSTEANGTVEATSVTNTYTYDARGNRTQMVEAYGLSEQRATNYTYNALNQLIEQTGDAVYVLANSFNSGGTVTPTTTYTYDARGNLIETVDPNGNKTFTYYDALNRKIATVDALGDLSTWTYDADGNVTAATAYGTTVTLPSSPGGTPPSPVDPTNNRTRTYTYDRDGRVLTSTIANVLIGSWDGSSYVTSTSNLTTTNVYDADGNLVEQTDANGNNTFNYYDKLGRMIAQVDGDKYLTTYTLDSNGNVTQEYEYANALTTTPTTSSAVSALVANAGTGTPPDYDRITTFTYDLNGNRLTETRENVAASTVGGDGVSTTTANSTITYAYNGLGEVTRQTQATGDYTAYTYDDMGRQTQVQLSSYTGSSGATVQNTTSESYDGLNNLTRTSVYDADNSGTAAEVTQYTYGAGGRLATVTDADGFVHTYYYDANGNNVLVDYSRVTATTGTIIEGDASNYDALNRKIVQAVATYSGVTGWSYGDTYETYYDAFGEVAARGVNGMQQQTYSYNNAGQMWATTANNGSVQMYVYDANGNKTLEIDTDGSALPSGYSWSALMQSGSPAEAISLLTNNGANTIGATDPDSVGMVVMFTAYDGRNQATATIEPFRQLSGSTGDYTTQTLTASQAYDAFGDVLSSTDARGNTTNYTYSTLGKDLTDAQPSVTYMQTNGTTTAGRPTTYYYYDISGRQVATKDANGNTATEVLLANTGYDGSTALAVTTYDPDGGHSTNGYDVFGNVITATNQVGDITTNTYDAMNRLIAQANPTVATQTVGGVTQDAVQLINYYAYDGLGQRIKTWNNQLGSSDVSTTDYDAEGRVIKQVDFDGYSTTYSYTWTATAPTTGMGTFGGWVKSTTNSTGLTESETDDYFGREIVLDGFNGFDTSFTFDLAGRLSSATENYYLDAATSYTYFNTGLVAGEGEGYTVSGQYKAGPSTYLPYHESYALTETYGYDANGNRALETYSENIYSRAKGINETISYEDATATWDALNRLSTLQDSGNGTSDVGNGVTPMTLDYYYDLNGNVIEQAATYTTLSNSGAPSSPASQTEWFAYDSMNREVIEDGALSGGNVVAGTNGTAITYDTAGDRHTTTDSSGTTTYSYNAAGQLSGVQGGSYTAFYAYDAMGRQMSQAEWNVATVTTQSPVYSRTATYDADSNVLTDQVTTVRSDGSGTYVQDDIYSYVSSDGPGSGLTYPNLLDGANGSYQGGSVTNEATTTYKNGTLQESTNLETTYVWDDHAELHSTTYTAPGENYGTGYGYSWDGSISASDIQDGSPRDINYVTNLQGQVLDATTTTTTGAAMNAPDTEYFFFDGIQEGMVTNNGSGNVDYQASMTQQTATPGSGFFNNGATTGTSYAAFGTQLSAINSSGSQTSTAPSYTVEAGDTLQSIAQELWGDSSYWYLLADANGLSPSSQLEAGEMLVIPSVVGPSQNNATTNTVYNATQALGNITPDHAPPPPHNSSGCGVVGEIILAVVAIAVAFVTAGAAVAALAPAEAAAAGGGIAGGMGALAAGSVDFATAVAAGAIGGVAGSVVSQGVGLATGIQSKFNWAQVGEAAIGGAIGGGLGPNLANGAGGAFGGLTDSAFLNGLVSGAVGNALTQGVGVATGLQKQFDWSGVAAAGLGGGVTNAVTANATALGLSDLGSTGTRIVAGAAGLIANAAARTLVSGTDFGDNILKALPDAIGQTIGNAIGSEEDPLSGISPFPITAPNVDLSQLDTTLPDVTVDDGSDAGPTGPNTFGYSSASPPMFGGSQTLFENMGETATQQSDIGSGGETSPAHLIYIPGFTEVFDGVSDAFQWVGNELFGKTPEVIVTEADGSQGQSGTTFASAVPDAQPITAGVSSLSFLTPRQYRSPQQQITWSSTLPGRIPSPGQDTPWHAAEAIQDAYHSGTGAPFYVDPKAIQLERGINIGDNMQTSIINNNYMKQIVNQSLRTGKPVPFSSAAWYPKTGFEQFDSTLGNLNTPAGQTVGRVNGAVKGMLMANADGTYTAKGTIQFSKSNPYNYDLDAGPVGDAALFVDGYTPNPRLGWDFNNKGVSVPLSFTRDANFSVTGYYR